MGPSTVPFLAYEETASIGGIGVGVITDSPSAGKSK